MNGDKPTIESGSNILGRQLLRDKPKTVKEALVQWDNGGTLWTVEMGGLGPGYEQAIQIGTIELCRLMVDKEFPEDDGELDKMFDDGLHEVCRAYTRATKRGN